MIYVGWNFYDWYVIGVFGVFVNGIVNYLLNGFFFVSVILNVVLNIMRFYFIIFKFFLLIRFFCFY